MQKINDLIKSVDALVYYSQINTVEGVQPVNMTTHDQAWRDAQRWLWDNCIADSYGNYSLKQSLTEDKELEQLKAELSKMWMDYVAIPCRKEGCSEELIDQHWQQFKAKHNL